MKNIFLHSIFILLLSNNIYSQDRNYIQRPTLGMHLLFNFFTYNDSLHTPGKYNNIKAGIALDYLRGFTPRLDLNTTLTASFISNTGKLPADDSKHLLLEADVSLREKLFPGKHRINPFLQAGAGVAKYAQYYGLFIPAGAGIQADLPGETFLLLHMQYRIPVTDDEPRHFYASLGISGIIGKKKTLPKKKISLPAGSAATNRFARDSDGDGIPDSADACPLVPGSRTFNGCPDTDGDGIPDKDDKCPTVRGISSLQGCPPPGKKIGLPPIRENIRQRIELAAKNIFFETDKYVLLPASNRALNEVIDILKQNTFFRLSIKGHTDNSGTPEKNRVLSERRAGAVMEYLITVGGISSERLSAEGFGSTLPIATNDTPEGKAQNRRVELTLRY